MQVGWPAPKKKVSVRDGVKGWGGGGPVEAADGRRGDAGGRGRRSRPVAGLLMWRSTKKEPG
jgi:hypothetical protein